jgi:hypothetical protein
LRLSAIHQSGAGVFRQRILGAMDTAVHEIATPHNFDRKFIVSLVQA